jgi:hypothetical protein
VCPLSSLRKVDKKSDGLLLSFKGKEKEPKDVFVPNYMIDEICGAIQSLTVNGDFTQRKESVLRRSFMSQGPADVSIGSTSVKRRGDGRGPQTSSMSQLQSTDKKSRLSSVDRALVAG